MEYCEIRFLPDSRKENQMATTQPVRVPERRPEPSETPAASTTSHSVPAPRKQPFTIKVKGMIPT